MTTTITTALNAEGCLFCLTHEGGFTSREHILSEGFGNIDERVLPPGVVCDRCNQGPLSHADEALVNFQPITLLRSQLGIPTKAGKPVVSTWGNARVAWSAPGTMEVATKSRKVLRGMHRFDPERGVPGELSLKAGGPVTTKRIGRIVRSVWKSALEFVYVDQGPDAAFDQILDEVREAVLGETSRGWAMVPMDCKTREDVGFTYFHPVMVDDRPSLPICVNVFGVVILTDALLRDIDAERIDVGVPVNRWKF